MLAPERAGWIDARPWIKAAIEMSDGVLLAYGLSVPSGPARHHHKRQVDWLLEQLSQVPVWQFGGSPRHPSRWQRWTHRHHPDIGFEIGREAGTPTVGGDPLLES